MPNGWLYFTKEVFDLFYPSYGRYLSNVHGAIGMTLRTGRCPSGGADCYLLMMAIHLHYLTGPTHHYTTSLSTIEISSINAAKLVKEFRKYFNDAVHQA
jgi:hypothetical protein